jgi:hypothetical protein
MMTNTALEVTQILKETIFEQMRGRKYWGLRRILGLKLRLPRKICRDLITRG